MIWRLAKLNNLRGIDWLKLVLYSSGRRLTRATSVDSPMEQENLRGTGRLHALVHIFAPRSGAQAMSEDSIFWYGRPFIQTDGLICVLHVNKVLWRLGKLKKTCGVSIS